MAEDTSKDKKEPGTSGIRERVLDEQKLVNEREHDPGEFGGMAEPPVETDEPPVRPEMREETPRDELEPETRRPREQADIERQGS